MTNTIPDRTTLAQQKADLENGAVTAVRLTEQALARIAATQPTLNAFRVIRGEDALEEAAMADRRLAAGERLPLLGIPIAIKDEVDLAGYPTAFGTRCRPEPAREDCEMVRRLKAAGAIIVGKAHSSELGQWPLTGGPDIGHTHNPWQRGRTAGGSSGGSAAAVAAGLVAAAMGSDGAGSLRIPAAWNHLVSIKPQRGRIPTSPWPEMFNGLTVFGPLTSTVGDAALLLDAVSGPHADDRHQPLDLKVSDQVGRNPGRLRVALSLEPPFTGVPIELDPQIRASLEQLAERLAQLGHQVTEDNPDYGKLLGLNFLPRSLAGLDEWERRLPDPHNLDPRTRQNARSGRALRGLPLSAARRAEPRLRRRVGRIFQRADIVLAPCTATLPPSVDAIDNTSPLETTRRIISYCPYTWPWNVLGWPSVSVPAGFSTEGLPIGAQLMGPANSEPLLVALAAQLEAEARWHEKTPPRWW
ncbi:amidase [Marinobacteraceae bacterium S3BR75-40.1]